MRFLVTLTSVLCLLAPVVASAQTSAQKYPLYPPSRPFYPQAKQERWQPPAYNDLPRVPGTSPWNNPYYQSGKPFPLQHYIPDNG